MLGREELLEEVTKLPTQAGTAARLLPMLDDPDSSAMQIGEVIETDPALTLQVIRMANAPYYGMSREIASPMQAVTVLGFAMIRSLAAAAAFKLHTQGGGALPPGFWKHSITTGAAAMTFAGRTGFPPTDAFSAGLLVDIGDALLMRHDPTQWEWIRQKMSDTGKTQVLTELEELDITHADISAYALDQLNFPPGVVQATGEHHLAPNEDSSRLSRALYAADVLAHEIDGTTTESGVGLEQAFEYCGLNFAEADQIRETVIADTEHLESLLSL